jgi:hypothetical protein
MASLSERSATLKRHSAGAGDPVTAIQARFSRAEDTMTVSYDLEGELTRLRIPCPRAPRFAKRLWQHTCFELFLRRESGDAYHEVNLSPSGEWAVYAFERYREPAPVEVTTWTPRTTLHTERSRLQLEVAVSLRDIDPSYADAALRVGVSAVMEDAEGALSYWALAHSSDKPDFHHPDSFVLQL